MRNRLSELILVAVFILLLAACGTIEPGETTATSSAAIETTQTTVSSVSENSQAQTEESFYQTKEPEKADSRTDTVSELFYYSYLLALDYNSVGFEGGGIKYLRTDFLSGNDYPVFGKDDYDQKSLAVRFYEDSKLLYPICFDFTCAHDTAECFANSELFFLTGSNAAAVADNSSICFVYGSHPVTAVSYSHDGTQLKSVDFDVSALVKQDGSIAKNANARSFCRYGGKIYFDVTGYDQYSELDLWESGTKNVLDRWIVAFDVDTFEFSVICNYSAPDPYSDRFEFTECSDNYVGVDYDGRYAFCIDLSDGTYSEYDCVTLFDGLISDGTAQQGDYVESIYPISKIMLMGGAQGLSYCDIETGDKLDVDLLKRSSLEPMSQFEYGKDAYFYCADQGDNPNDYIRYIRCSDGNILELSRTFADGGYYVSSLVLLSGDGLIYQYYDSGTTANDERYTVTEDQVEVTYQKAPRYVYVSFDDMSDGQIDEPWYYDAETGMFEQ